MKKFKLVALASLLILSTGAIIAQKKIDVKPVGTWAYVANDAPNEYSSGNIVITKEGKEYAGELVYSEYHKLKTHDFKIEGDKISFKAYVEGETIYCKGTFVEKDKIAAEVSYSEGTIKLSATRNKK